MPDFNCGAVITVGPDREQNLSRVLSALEAQTIRPSRIVLVFDGIAPYALTERHTPITVVESRKHVPGYEQPRNVGVRTLIEEEPDCTHVWFLDSDIETGPNCLQEYKDAHSLVDRERILIGPYDWLPQGAQGTNPDGPFFQRDDRWDGNGFNDFPPDRVIDGDITVWDPEDIETRGRISFLMGAGGAQYGGNLVWLIANFVRIGGFHPNMHHGRCEDGELGFRAMAHGMGVSFVREARGYHLFHPRNMDWILSVNPGEVAKLHQWHPWLVDYKAVPYGSRKVPYIFDCGVCGERVDSLAWWEHAGTHPTP